MPESSTQHHISPVLDTLPHGLLLAVLSKWTSIFCLQNLRVTCKGINALITSEEHTAARASEGIVDRALVIVSNDETNDIFAYHVLVNGSWRRAPWNAENSLLDFEASVISRSASGEHVLFIGNDRRSCSTLVNIKTGQSRTLPDHQIRRRSPAVCHLGARTILAGGFEDHPDDTTTFASVEMFDPSRNMWSFLPDMPHATSEATACVIGQNVYVAGGRGNRPGEKWTYLQVYDTILETWELGPKMPEYLYMTSCSVIEDTLHIVGMSQVTDSYVCVYFIPESKEWKYADTIDLPVECSMHDIYGMGNATYWYELGNNGDWSKIPSAVVPDIPDHLVGQIESVVSTVFKL